MELIEIISKKSLCFQCGTCASICKKNCIKMERNLEKGLVLPNIINRKDCTNCKLCEKVCPVLNINTPEDQFKCEEISIYKSLDREIYIRSSSGGVVGSTLKYLLDKKIINRALVAGINGIYSEPQWIDDVSQINKIQGSKYQPIALNELLKDVKKGDKIAVVGLPCHISGVEKLCKVSKILNDAIVFKIGIFCTIGRGMNSTSLALNNVKENISGDLIYRDNNHPGNMVIKHNNKEIKITEHKKFLDDGDYIFYPKGCLFCNDLFNVKSDISVGDPWGLNNEKSALTLARTQYSKVILDNMVEEKYISKIKDVSKKEAESTQQHSYDFKIVKYNERYNLCKGALNGLNIDNDIIHQNSSVGLKYKMAIKFLYLNSIIFNSKIGLAIVNNKLSFKLIKKYRNFILRNGV